MSASNSFQVSLHLSTVSCMVTFKCQCVCTCFKASSVETYRCSNSTICSFLSSYILANGMASTSLMMAWSDLLRFSFPGFSSVNFCHQCFRYREHHVLAGGVSRQTEYLSNHHPPSPQPLPICIVYTKGGACV